VLLVVLFVLFGSIINHLFVLERGLGSVLHRVVYCTTWGPLTLISGLRYRRTSRVSSSCMHGSRVTAFGGVAPVALSGVRPGPVAWARLGAVEPRDAS
jgi:hypothetical protein